MNVTLSCVQWECDLEVVWLNVSRGGAFIGENCTSVGGMRGRDFVGNPYDV